MDSIAAAAMRRPRATGRFARIAGFPLSCRRTWPMLVNRVRLSDHRSEDAAPPRRAAVSEAVNRLVRDRTGALLSDLRVDVDAERSAGREFSVVLTGRCGSFYCKQLAGVAAMAAAPGSVVRNRILVG
ncbi:MAG: hypothetical protein AAF907_01235 [Planctomycetota bacterium]